jgi:thiamine biosynthesis lipoprotein
MHSKQSKNKQKPNPNEFATTLEFDAIGSHWQVDSSDPLSQVKQRDILQKIQTLTEAFDKAYSRFRPDSLVTLMAQKAGKYRLPEDVRPMLDLYQQLYELTGHAITPLIGQVLVDAGYDAQYSLQPKILQTPPSWESILTYKFPNLTLKQPVLLDFGALGKGYLIDLVSQLLQEENIRNFCVEAGGDMYYQTTQAKPLRVGLEHPDDSTMVIGVAEITNQSICASAGNRRRWSTFHHIISPVTLTSPTEVKASWVVANTALLADALATSLFFVPAKQLLEHFTFAYAIIAADNSLEASKDFPAEFFTT